MKRIGYLVVTLILMMMVVKVNALTDVDCITGAGSRTCTLSDDIEVSEQLAVQGQVVLDLNGHTIYASSTANFTSGILGVKRGATLTIKDTVGTGKITTGNTTVYAAVAVTVPGETNTGSVATLVVDGGTLEGYYYAVTGNGNRHNTSITINGGTLRVLAEGDGTGIYHPQEGTLIINGGSITGDTGIEMRSGVLRVNGGTIEGTGIPTSVTPNGSGTTISGAGLAVAQHTTKKDIDVKIKGGTIRGFSALYESNPQNNPNVANQISLVVTGGEFEAINNGEAVVYSEDLTDFIVRGTFNKTLDSSYISDDSEVKVVDGNYVIGSDNYTEFDDEADYDMDTSYDSAVYVSPVETYDVDISWDDLHWVFVYEGSAANPTRNVWVTKEHYDTTRASKSHLSLNELNGDILDNTENLASPEVEILVENNSVFAIDVLASIESKSNANYTNSAGLQIAVDTSANNVFGNQANVSALATNGSANILVKPTAVRFVNDTGTTANVTGEVNITISKTN